MDEIKKSIDRVNTFFKITVFLYIVILILVVVKGLQAPQATQESDYVTREEVHEIVDSILIQIYD